jgi:hypothetical protein
VVVLVVREVELDLDVLAGDLGAAADLAALEPAERRLDLADRLGVAVLERAVACAGEALLDLVGTPVGTGIMNRP